MKNKIKEFKDKHPNVFTAICVGGAAAATFVITRKIDISKFTKFMKAHRNTPHYSISEDLLVDLTDYNGNHNSDILHFISEYTTNNGEVVRGFSDLPEFVYGKDSITMGEFQDAIDDIFEQGLATADSEVTLGMVNWIVK